MEDIDVPFSIVELHVIALFAPNITQLNERDLSKENDSIQFIPNNRGRLGYGGPRALAGHGIHRYWFHLYALNEVITINNFNNFQELLPELEGKVIGRAHFEGLQKG